MQTNCDLVVIGGGVSGVVLAAHAAKSGRSVVLLEKEERIGGCLHSWRPTGDFWLELGGHTAYNSYKPLLELLDERGWLGRLQAREALGYKFCQGRRFVSPLARLGWLELAWNLPLGLSRDKRGEDLERYYGALFGRRNYRRLFAPAFSAVLSQPADRYPAEWLFRRKPRMKSAPRKYTWPGGLQGILEALTGDAAFRVRLGTPVGGLDRTVDGYRIEVEGEHFQCQRIALTTPPDVAADLLREVNPPLAAQLKAIPMADIETLAVVLPAEATQVPKLAGIIGDDDAFYSAVTRDPVPHPTLRGFTFHFRPGRLDRDGKLRRIAQVLGTSPDEFLYVEEKLNRLPAAEVRHVALAAEIDRQLQGGTLALAGNYLNGLSIGDCAERAAREARKLFPDAR